MQKINKLFKYFVNRTFIKYTLVGLLTSGSGIALLWFMVDILAMWVVWAGIVETGFVYIMRFILYDWFKVFGRIGRDVDV